MKAVALFGFVLGLVAGGSSAMPGVPAPKEILGLSLGSPFALNECPVESVGSFRMYASIYSNPGVAPCFKRRFTPDSPLNLQAGKIFVVFDDVPAGFKSDASVGWLVDGRLEGLWLYTYGLKVQDRVLEALRAKYGEPTSISTSKWQNRMGATFDGIEATWQFPDLTVVFTGLGDTIDTGYVTIDTPAAIAAQAAEEAAKKEAETKL